MNYHVDIIVESEYPEVVEVWEASVRATHHFLREEDIAYFKPLILMVYLKAVSLRSVRNGQGKIIGFMGVADHKLEMLFVHPDEFGKGIGKMLVHEAIKKFGVTQVEVNEDNQQAVGFYEHLGFTMTKRSPLDGLGKPYPILSMTRDNIPFIKDDA